MKLLDYRDKLLQLDQLIRLQVKGSPYELSQRMSISEATFFRLLEVLKLLAIEQQIEISYNRELKRYTYSQDAKLQFNFALC